MIIAVHSADVKVLPVWSLGTGSVGSLLLRSSWTCQSTCCGSWSIDAVHTQ